MSDTVTAVDNPLLDEYYRRANHLAECTDRWPINDGQPSYYGCCEAMRADGEMGSKIRSRFSWAVPDDYALDLIARHSPNGVVEIGAGLGYWARMLTARGVDVHAYDIAPEGNNWCEGEPWHPVAVGGPELAGEYPSRTLLLCWPPMTSMAAEAVNAYRGDTIVYIGEGPGGCTADDTFHVQVSGKGARYCWECEDEDEGECSYHPPCSEIPDPAWRQVDGWQHPQWWGLHDRVYVYRRLGTEVSL